LPREPVGLKESVEAYREKTIGLHRKDRGDLSDLGEQVLWSAKE